MYVYLYSMVILKLLLDSFYIHTCNSALLVQKLYAQSVWAGLVRNPADSCTHSETMRQCFGT